MNKRIESTRKGVAPKILVLSNHNEAGSSWILNLRREPFEVILQEGLERAIESWEQENPDMVVVNVENYGSSILDLIGKLREATDHPILLLTSAIPEDQIVETYLKGVDECILKPVGPTLITAKIRAWLRRTRSMTAGAEEEIRVGDFLLKLSERTLSHGRQAPIQLTNLEVRLLHLLMSHSPRTVSYDEMIYRVWGNSSDADYGALKNVVYRLRLKIESNPNEPSYLVTLPGAGYRFEPGQD